LRRFDKIQQCDTAGRTDAATIANKHLAPISDSAFYRITSVLILL